MVDNRTPPKFQAVSHRRLTEEIADQIEHLILNEELQIGDALPPERELAAQLGVSRNILREAISTLVQKGLLEVRPGSGTYVARPSAEFLSDTLEFFVRFNSTALLDLIEVRRSLEIEIAGLAAERATAADCQLINKYLEEMQFTKNSPEAYVEADINFHEALAKAAKNKIMQMVLTSIRGALRANIRILAEHHPSAVDEAMHSHQQIAEAVEQHAVEAARLAMREHLENVGRSLRELQLQEPDSPDGTETE